ncbi:hypothetical protein Tco_1182691 [Tanacetum coccineum]
MSSWKHVNPPYKFKWTEKTVPVAEGCSETTIEGYMENYKNVSLDIRNQLDAEAEAVQIILIGIDNDIYSIVDACLKTCEMWKAIERFYKIMNELVKDQCDVTNHQVNVQFLLQLQVEWQRFVTLVKQSQQLKTVSYHKLNDILKQHRNEVNELRAERLAHTVNPLALVAQQQPVYHPQNHHTQINKGTRNDNQREFNVVGARENGMSKPKRAKDATYHKEKMLLCKQEEAGIQLSAEKADWGDDTDDELEDQELEAPYLYMTQIQEVALDVANNSGPIFDAEPLQKVHNDYDNYNVFANDREHPKQPESVNNAYLEEQCDTNITINSLDMSTNGETIDQDNDDLAKEHDLFASLIDKL